VFGVFWFISMDEHVYLYPDHLVCTRPFRKSVVLYYDRCMVGMDYATTTGSTDWWIYLSYGPLPKYKGNSPANRINSLRTNQEFVRIMYYEEVYEALLQVLPKHQKVCLQSAYHMRCRDARYVWFLLSTAGGTGPPPPRRFPSFRCIFAGENVAAAEILLPFYKPLAFSGTMW